MVLLSYYPILWQMILIRLKKTALVSFLSLVLLRNEFKDIQDNAAFVSLSTLLVLVCKDFNDIQDNTV